MKRALFVLLALCVLGGLTGCAANHTCCAKHGGSLSDLVLAKGTHSKDPCGHGSGLGRRGDDCPGPPSGAVTYPYYTLHGPRDFLARSPRPIGP
ncbi:MAG: hypothetical protein ACYTG0_29610 [Planctomycetota bacterium]|jgi:hypothetical protein